MEETDIEVCLKRKRKTERIPKKTIVKLIKLRSYDVW